VTPSGSTPPPLAPPLPLTIDPEAFRRLAHAAADLVADHLAGIRTRPVFAPMTPAERAALLERPLPDRGIEPDALLALAGREVLTHPMGNGHPRFFGWVNSPPAPIGILAEFLAAALDPSCVGGDHAAIYVERAAMRWMMELVEFPVEGSMGLLVSGGSMASLTCLGAARHRVALADGWDVRARGLQGAQPPLILYLSEEGHSCLRKAAEVLGLGQDAVRTVPVDSDLRMDVEALRAAVTADRRAGRRPFCVAASAGTVNTGAIDPLEEIAVVCQAEGLWLHVDGAYGAIGAADPALAPRYAGLERADSLALDPHKWLSVPVECGCALVRDGRLLRDTWSLVPPLPPERGGQGIRRPPLVLGVRVPADPGLPGAQALDDAPAHGPERCGRARPPPRGPGAPSRGRRRPGSRPLPSGTRGAIRGLLPLRAPGMDRGRGPARRAQQDPGRADPGRRPGLPHGDSAGGRFALRACVLHYGTTEADVDTLVEVVQEIGVRQSGA
jgi:hypothetical protein